MNLAAKRSQRGGIDPGSTERPNVTLKMVENRAIGRMRLEGLRIHPLCQTACGKTRTVQEPGRGRAEDFNQYALGLS